LQQHQGVLHLIHHLVSLGLGISCSAESINRGLIGPERMFSNGSIYHPQVWAALVGALVPIPLWFWVRKYPRSIFRNFNIPIILNGGLQIPPATGVNYSSWLVGGFIFQFWIRRRKFAWWSKVSVI